VAKKTDAKEVAGMKVVRVPLDELNELPGNARTHGEKNLAAIKHSLEKFGQVEALIFQASTKNLIGGNGRLRAMRELGWKDAACLPLDVDDATAHALALALNRTSELAGWDNEILGHTLATLQEEGWELPLLGWQEEEFKPIIEEAFPAPLEEPAPPSEFRELGEDIETKYRCPKCAYEWSGQPKPGGAVDGDAGDP